MGFSRQEYWSGLPFPSPGDLPDPGIEPTSPALAGGFFATSAKEAPPLMCVSIYPTGLFLHRTLTSTIQYHQDINSLQAPSITLSGQTAKQNLGRKFGYIGYIPYVIIKGWCFRMAIHLLEKRVSLKARLFNI